MATLDVPGTFPTISAAVAAAASGDTILVASGYGGNEAVDVDVDNLFFSVAPGVPNVVLTARPTVARITLFDESSVRIIGNARNNTFVGNTGDNDISDGGGGNDTIDGGIGNDTITSSGGTDTLSGGEGDDRFFLDIEEGGGTVDGGGGDDTVFSPHLAGYSFTNVETLDTFYGFVDGTVTQIASFSNFTASLAAPDARIEISLLGAGGALDFTTSFGGDLSVGIRDAGLTSAIEITGSINGDFLFGSAFNDVLRGGDGDDTLVGGSGKDSLFGGAGADVLAGGEGNDILTGNGDGDTATYFDAIGVRVSLGKTTAQHTKSAGADTLTGIANLIGSDYDDALTGDGTDNRLVGDLGNDMLRGGDGGDTLNAGNGNDQLSGGDGNDFLKGGRGDDLIVGSAGHDRLAGGLGADRFVYSGHFGRDRIADFSVAEGDVIQFVSPWFDSFASLSGQMSQVGADVLIDVNHARQITLQGVQLGDLTAANFVFG